MNEKLPESMPAKGMRIDYASAQTDPVIYGLLRKCVAIVAIILSLKALTGTALYVAMANGWVKTPPNTAWEMGGIYQRALLIVGVACNVHYRTVKTGNA